MFFGDGTFIRVSIYPFKLSCLASWMFRLLLSPSFLVVAMIFTWLIFCHFLSHAYQINFQRWIFSVTPIKSIFNMGFSQSRLSNGKMAASYSFFFLAVLDLGDGRGICIIDAFISLFIVNEIKILSFLSSSVYKIDKYM